MEYIDPHHKRSEFTAESFSSSVDNAVLRVVFTGHGQHQSVVLKEQGPNIVATVPEAECDFVLWKTQLMETPRWLTLDFEKNPLLSRIVIHIGDLNADDLDAALTALIGSRSLLYFKRPAD